MFPSRSNLPYVNETNYIQCRRLTGLIGTGVGVADKEKTKARQDASSRPRGRHGPRASSPRHRPPLAMSPRLAGAIEWNKIRQSIPIVRSPASEDSVSPSSGPNLDLLSHPQSPWVSFS